MSSRPREVYSHGHHASVLRSHRWRTAENSAAYLLPHLRTSDHVLDVGCGPGTITLDLAARLRSGRVVGVDSAPDVVAAAQQEAATLGFDGSTGVGADRVEFVFGDVYALDFDDDSFDVVHAHQVLQHLGDPIAALQEMRRVCRPGGLVAARDADYAAMTWHPHNAGLDRWLDLYHRVARSNGGEPDSGRRLRSWGLSAGFRAVRASASAWCFAEEDVAWWSQSWAERVTESNFANQALGAGLAQPSELQALAAAWRDWATAPDAWFAILHAEILCTV